MLILCWNVLTLGELCEKCTCVSGYVSRVEKKLCVCVIYQIVDQTLGHTNVDQKNVM